MTSLSKPETPKIYDQTPKIYDQTPKNKPEIPRRKIGAFLQRQ